MLEGGQSAQVVKSLRGEKLTVNGKIKAPGELKKSGEDK